MITNDDDILEMLEMSKEQILNFVSVWISEGSGWVIKSVDNHCSNIAKYKPMNWKSYWIISWITSSEKKDWSIQKMKIRNVSGGVISYI